MKRIYIPTPVKVALAGSFNLNPIDADNYLSEYRLEHVDTRTLFANIKDGTYKGYAITWMLRPSSVRNHSMCRLSYRTPKEGCNDINRVLITGLLDDRVP